MEAISHTSEMATDASTLVDNNPSQFSSTTPQKRYFKLAPTQMYRIDSNVECQLAVNLLENSTYITGSRLGVAQILAASNETSRQMRTLTNALMSSTNPHSGSYVELYSYNTNCTIDESCHINSVRLDLEGANIPEPDTLVLACTMAALLIDYPVIIPSVVIIDTDNPQGFTNRRLFQAISSTFLAVLQEDIDKSKQKVLTDGMGRQEIKRTGPFQIFEKKLMHLHIVRISYNSVISCITLKLASHPNTRF